ECLRAFNDEWGVRGLARGAIVVILSDGWDRGDPAVLGEQMQRLQRVTYDLIWVNPLKVSPGYAPLARGMAAALPYVDHFVEGHSLAAMEELGNVIAGVSARRAWCESCWKTSIGGGLRARMLPLPGWSTSKARGRANRARRWPSTVT